MTSSWDFRLFKLLSITINRNNLLSVTFYVYLFSLLGLWIGLLLSTALIIAYGLFMEGSQSVTTSKDESPSVFPFRDDIFWRRESERPSHFCLPSPSDRETFSENCFLILPPDCDRLIGRPTHSFSLRVTDQTYTKYNSWSCWALGLPVLPSFASSWSCGYHPMIWWSLHEHEQLAMLQFDVVQHLLLIMHVCMSLCMGAGYYFFLFPYSEGKE